VAVPVVPTAVVVPVVTPGAGVVIPGPVDKAGQS